MKTIATFLARAFFAGLAFVCLVWAALTSSIILIALLILGFAVCMDCATTEKEDAP